MFGVSDTNHNATRIVKDVVEKCTDAAFLRLICLALFLSTLLNSVLGQSAHDSSESITEIVLR